MSHYNNAAIFHRWEDGSNEMAVGQTQATTPSCVLLILAIVLCGLLCPRSASAAGTAYTLSTLTSGNTWNTPSLWSPSGSTAGPGNTSGDTSDTASLSLGALSAAWTMNLNSSPNLTGLTVTSSGAYGVTLSAGTPTSSTLTLYGATPSISATLASGQTFTLGGINLDPTLTGVVLTKTASPTTTSVNNTWQLNNDTAADNFFRALGGSGGLAIGNPGTFTIQWNYTPTTTHTLTFPALTRPAASSSQFIMKATCKSTVADTAFTMNQTLTTSLINSLLLDGATYTLASGAAIQGIPITIGTGSGGGKSYSKLIWNSLNNGSQPVSSFLIGDQSYGSSGIPDLYFDPGASGTLTVTTTLGLGNLTGAGTGARNGSTTCEINSGTMTVTTDCNVANTSLTTLNDTETGQLTIQGGTLVVSGNLRIGNASGFGIGKGDVFLNSGTLKVANPIITGNNTSQNSSNHRGILNFNGGTLQANGAALNVVASTVVGNVQAGGAKIDNLGNAVTLGAALLTGASPDGGLTSLGSGSLTLNSANTYNGGTFIQNGTLKVNAPATVSPTVTPNFLLNVSGVSFAAGSLTVTLANANTLGVLAGMQVAGTGVSVYSGVVAASSVTSIGFTFYNDGKISYPTTSVGTYNFGNAYQLIVSSATGLTPGQSVTASSGIPANTYIKSINGTTLTLSAACTAAPSGVTFGAWQSLPPATTVTLGTSTTAGTLDLNGVNQTIGGLAIGSGATAASQLIGNSSTANNSTLQFTGGGTPSTFGGTIQDTLGSGNKTVALTTTAGTLTLSGPNTYSGGTTLTGGTLSFGSDNSSAGGSAPLGKVPSSATAGNVVINGGTLSASAGFTLNANRGLALGPTSGSGSGTIDVASSQTLNYGGIIANNGGTGNLIKTSAGTLTLTGNNTYSGTTTISGGTLRVNSQTSPNSGTGSGTVSVNAGGQLSGNGRISGAVTVANNATAVLYPNISGGGMLTLGNSLTLGVNSLVKFDLSNTVGGANDKVVLENQTVTSGGAQITINTSAANLDTADYTLIDAGTGNIPANFNSAPLWSNVTPGNAANFTVVTSAHQVTLHYNSSIPPTATSAASPSSGLHQIYLLTVSVTPGSIPASTGLGVTVDLSGIGGSGSQTFYDDGTHGDATAGDNVFSYSYAVPPATAVGSKSLPFTVTDAQARSFLGTIALTIANGTLTWDGNGPDNNWSSANWTGAYPGITGDAITFAGITRLAPVMNNSYSVTGLSFNGGAGGFNITASGGSTLTLSSAGTVANNSVNAQTLNVPIILGAAQSFNAASGDLTCGETVNNGGNLLTVNGAKNTTISGSISGAGGLTTAGTGTVTLGSANTYGGATSLGGGTLALSGGNNTLPVNNGVSFTAASTLDLGANNQTVANLTAANGVTSMVQNGNLIVTASTGYSPLSALTSSSTLDFSGLSSFTYNQSTKNFTVQGTTTTSGQIFKMNLAGGSGGNNITAANVYVGNGGSTGIPTGSLYLGQNNVFNTGNFQLGNYQGAGNVYFESGLTSSNVTFRGTAGGSSRVTTMTVGLESSGVSMSETMDLGAATVNAMVTTLQIMNTTLATITETGTLNFGNGIFDITTLDVAVPNFTATATATTVGNFNQNGGLAKIQTLNLGHNVNTGTPIIKASYTLASGATLASQTITGSGTLFSSSSVRNLNLNGGTVSNYDAGTDLTISGVDGTSGGLVNVVLGAGTTSTFNVGSGRAISVQSTAPIGGSGSLSKTGAGMLTLAAVNSFTGGTSVNAGEIINVTGGSSANSLFTVSSGATNGVRLAAAGGQWSCGGLTLNSGATYVDFDFAGNPPSATTAPMDVGTLILGGTVNVLLNNVTYPATVGNYPLIHYTGTDPSAGSFNLNSPLPFAITNAAGKLVVDAVAKNVSINVGLVVPNLAYTNTWVSRQIALADILAAGLASSQGSPVYSITLPSAASTHDGSVMTNFAGDMISYTPPAGTPASDSFSYTVSDGVNRATATVTIAFTSAAGTQLTPAIDGNNNPAISFHGLHGYSYHIQRATTLANGGDWTNVQPVSLPANGNGSYSWTDTSITVPPSTAYYRISYP